MGPSDLIGLVIEDVRMMTTAELRAEGWAEWRIVPAVVLSNGTILYPSTDQDGSDSGDLFCKDVMGSHDKVHVL